MSGMAVLPCWGPGLAAWLSRDGVQGHYTHPRTPFTATWHCRQGAPWLILMATSPAALSVDPAPVSFSLVGWRVAGHDSVGTVGASRVSEQDAHVHTADEGAYGVAAWLHYGLFCLAG